MATGRCTDVLRNLGFFTESLFVVFIVFGFQFGIVGVAAAFIFADLILFFVTFYFTLKCVHLFASDLVRSVWQPTTIALLMAAAITIADNLPPVAQAQPWLRLIILVPAGAAFYFAMIAFTSPHLLILLKQAIWERPE